MDAKINGLDMPKVVTVLLALLEGQEHAKLTYTVERKPEEKTA